LVTISFLFFQRFSGLEILPTIFGKF